MTTIDLTAADLTTPAPTTAPAALAPHQPVPAGRIRCPRAAALRAPRTTHPGRTPCPAHAPDFVSTPQVTREQRPAPGAAAAAVVETVVAEHGAAMQNYARRLCGDADTAQDLVQEAFLRAWRHHEKLTEDRGSVRGWLMTVVRNLDIDRRRAAAARPADKLTSLEVGESEALEDESTSGRLRVVEDRTVVTRLLAELPEPEREVLVRLYLLDESYATAAEALGVPVGTVKSRSFYALRHLRAVAGEQSLGRAS